jgi:hypothetical protein
MVVLVAGSAWSRMTRSGIGTVTELSKSMPLTVDLHQGFCASPIRKNDWVLEVAGYRAGELKAKGEQP